MKTTLIELNKPNLNGRIYTKECVEEALTKRPSSILIHSESGDPNATMLPAVVGTAQLSIEEDCLVACCVFMSPDTAKKVEDKKLFVRTSGTGFTVGSSVRDYHIDYLFLTDNPA